MHQTGPIDYSRTQTPNGYRCTCGAEGCKLWRPHMKTVPKDGIVPLSCSECAARDEKVNISGIDKKGEYTTDAGKTNEIGNLVPAIPAKDGRFYHPKNSCPLEALNWWLRIRTMPL